MTTGNSKNGFEERLKDLEEKLKGIESVQEERFLLVMKFFIVRNISILSLMVEQLPAPARIVAEAQNMISENTKKIFDASNLEEIREIDMALQDHLRGLLATFKR